MTKKKPEVRTSRPSIDPEERDKQLMNEAYNLAEKQLKDGTASPSVIGHFLKLASKRETLEREILEKQKILIDAKSSSIGQSKETKELVEAAMEAIKKYRPSNHE